MKLETICKYYNKSRTVLKTSAKYNLNPELTLKYYKIGCYNCNGYDKSCNKYHSNMPKKDDYKYEIIED